MTSEEDKILRNLLWSLTACQTPLARYDAYYEGQQPLKFMAPALKVEFG